MDNKGRTTPKWLVELQQKSWEPEILLSGIVLYGMFKVPGLLDDFLYYFKVNISGQTTDVDNFVSLMKVAVYWLITGLILHLISRGIWIGMVGLSFTFPKGIRREDLKLAPKFEKSIGKIPDIQQVILNLESFSSTLFSISFMLFMLMIGAYFYLFVTIILPVVSAFYFFGFDFDAYGVYLAIYIMTILTIGFLGFIDFITLGFLKRIKWLSKVYFPLYRFVGTLTLARFYRPVYYVLLTNFKKWKIAVFMISFVLISVRWVGGVADQRYPGEDLSQISLWSDSHNTSAFSGYYDDQIDEIKSIEAQIQSDIIRGNTLRLFIVSRAEREDSIKTYCNYDSLIRNDEINISEAKLSCLKTFYSVSINDSLFKEPPAKFHYKSKTKQRGILVYLNIDYLEQGLHHVKVELPEDMYENRRRRLATIPFYKENVGPLVIPEVIPIESEKEEESYLKLKPILPK